MAPRVSWRSQPRSINTPQRSESAEIAAGESRSMTLSQRLIRSAAPGRSIGPKVRLRVSCLVGGTRPEYILKLTSVDFAIVYEAMDLISEATAVLRKAELSLKELVSRAASLGDYSSAVQIAGWAHVVSEETKGQPKKQTRSGKSPTEPYKRSARGADRKRDYPRFYRQGSRVVRVAWSKRERKEYEHKAPSTVLSSMMQRMIEKGGDGRIFPTEELLPLTDRDGSNYPSYQAYLAIALFKQAGLIEQHGRQGYSIRDARAFEGTVDTLFRNLPTR